MKERIRDNGSLALEVKLNLEKAQEKLNSAELLYKKQYFDDSASRAYYAILHAIVACLRLKKVDLERHKHAYILNQFRSHFVDSSIFPAEMYGKIQSIRSSREQADYSFKIKILEQDAKEILADAQTIVKSIREYINSLK